MSVKLLSSVDDWIGSVRCISEQKLGIRVQTIHRNECLKFAVFVKMSCLSRQNAVSRTGFGNSDSRRCSSPLSPTISSNVTFVFTRRPDAAMRCNFRFRLQLAVVVVCFIIASTACASSSPMSDCHKTESQSFDDIVSRAILANVVFEGYLTSVRRPTAFIATSSPSPSVDAETSCHVTFKVKRLLKGELPHQHQSSPPSSSSSSSSNPGEFSQVVVRTQSYGGAGDGKTGNTEYKLCASAAADGTLTAELLRTAYVVFLSNAEDDVIDSGLRSSGSASRPLPRRNSRGSSSRGGAAAVYRFSSPLISATKSVVKQLTNINQSKSIRVPDVKLTLARRTKHKNQQSTVVHRVGSRIQLTCRAVGGRPANVAFVWTKNGTCLQSNGRVKIVQNKAKSTGQLQISSISVDDDGMYGCRAINVIGSSTVQTVRIEVERTVTKASPLQTTELPTSVIEDDGLALPATAHLRQCNNSEKLYCSNGGTCYVVAQLSSKKLCHCTAAFEGERCQERRNFLNPDVELGKSNILLALSRKRRMHAPVT